MFRLHVTANAAPSIQFFSVLGCGFTLVMCARLACAQANSDYSVVYRFTGGAPDGSFPSTGLIPDASGNLYGTTYNGGGTGCGGSGCGTVFMVTRNGNETPLYQFTGGNDGGLPVSDPHLTMDDEGNLYGSTYVGGQYGFGTIFELPKGGTETTLYAFMGGNDGASPWAAPSFGKKKAYLYGTTTAGGSSGLGTVYQLAPDGTETVLHAFGGGNDGQTPDDGLITDAKGNLYGTTFNGGKHTAGTVFKVRPDGKEMLLHAFTGSDGSLPSAALLADSAGNFYSTTYYGDQYDFGNVFKLAPDGTITTLYAFKGGLDGGDPYSSPIGEIGNKKGMLYATTYRGGAAGLGTVFKLVLSNGTWTETPLHSFMGGTDGALPVEGVTANADGFLYGTTGSGGTGCGSNGCGTVFRLKK
jgi:uncharacterized repeat protein (TIGR03803 family)